MNLVLIGYRGCGKTTIGRLLASRLGWSFVDTDALIEEGTGATIRELFSDGAEQAFRDLESEVVAEVARRDRQVISTGGGVVLRASNPAALKRNGKIVWFTAPAEVLWRRILGDKARLVNRPPADRSRGLEIVTRALAVREPLYARWADVVMDTRHRSPAELVDEVLAALHIPFERA
ncbi:MAG TPA: shikimate kinase [Phycisphaerae bacterium]|nr:shikimate kinase [Phycisphaerae bacterium]HRY66880.1 shikimate kinase [Phycisphaerae bacterium]HSA26938.1 shikimate kinase [Phycisphaerae bacterium]